MPFTIKNNNAPIPINVKHNVNMVAAFLWKWSLSTRNFTIGCTSKAIPYANIKGHTSGKTYFKITYDATKRPPIKANVVIFFLVILVIIAPPFITYITYVNTTLINK